MAPHHRRRTGADTVFHEVARDGLSLAHSCLHCLLHANAASGRPASLQQHDGPNHLYIVSGLFTPRDPAPSLHGSRHGAGFKFVQSVLTFMDELPTSLTVFTITASLEIAGRVRGERACLTRFGPGLGTNSSKPDRKSIMYILMHSRHCLGVGLRARQPTERIVHAEQLSVERLQLDLKWT